MRKKLRILAIIAVIASIFSGCATVEYLHSQENTGVITRRYTVFLDQAELSRYDESITVKEMKEFLFAFFGKVMGENLSPSEIGAESVRRDHSGRLEGLTEVITYNQQGKYISFIQRFESANVFHAYYGFGNSEGDTDEEDKPLIEKGFFFYKITEKLELPFRIVKQASEADSPAAIESDAAALFMFGDGTEDGFKGFRETFPQVKPQDVDKLLYRFVLGTPSKGYSSPDAIEKQTNANVSYLVWEVKSDAIDKSVTLVRLQPNNVGWFSLAIILAALFGGGLVLFWFLYRKSHPKVPPPTPTPVKTPPPAIFGEEYR